jgi:transmembrane sensor
MDASDRRRRASEEAAAWWVRLRSEELARAEREQFVDWLRESAVHVAEMLRVAKVHDALEQFRGWVQIATNGPDDDDGGDKIISLPPYPRSASSLVSLRAPGGEEHGARASLSDSRKGKTSDEALPGRTRGRFWLGAIAAGLAAVATLSVLLSPILQGQTIETDRGERREVVLADGSVLEIDPQTRIRVAFEDRTRRVYLERGRALFRVAKNATRPFLVQADGTTVRAVGTAFGVEHRDQGVIVTVAEGKVGVYASEVPARQELKESSTTGAAAPALTWIESGGRPTEVLLTAGQQVRMPSSGTAEPVRKVNSDRELAWAKGQLVLDDESVADAVAEFNRYNRIQLRVTDEALAMRRVSGVFDASDLESFIGFLQTVASVHVTRGESEIIMQ